MRSSQQRDSKNFTATDLSTDLINPTFNDISGRQSIAKENNTLKTMYFFACFANLVINLDHGILPACTQEVKHDIKIDEFGLGLLGSVVYIGLMIGSVTSGPLLQAYSSKKIIVFSTFGNILSLLIFPLTQNFILLCVSRGLVGFFQVNFLIAVIEFLLKVFLVIYFPVWVDSYGKDKKTLWITYLQLGVALGVFFGYGLTAIFVKFFTVDFQSLSYQ